MVAPEVVASEDDEAADTPPEPSPSSTSPRLADPALDDDDESTDDPAPDPDVSEERREAAQAKLDELAEAEPVYEEEMATPRFAADAGDSTGGSGMFDGTEDVDVSDEEEFKTDEQRAEGRAHELSDLGFEDSINNGFARLAVIGLDPGEEKDKLNTEFKEVFEQFRLGHYGEKCIEEYLLIDEEIDPVYGFAASLVVCFLMVLYLRPDGSEIASKVTSPLKGTLAGRKKSGGSA